MEFKHFKGQNYDELKKRHNSSNLFIDNVFPPETSSLGFSDDCLYKYGFMQIKWKRPSEIVNNPKFVVNGFDTIDVNQGFIGNCWFIAAIVSIIECPMILAKVMPSPQTFDGNDYSGIYHFRFCIYGDWYDVVIDDFLPFSESSQSLVFCHNKAQKNEFWPALLEKAFAKLNGSYESLEGGFLSTALATMTGGIVENLFPTIVASGELNKFWSSLFLSYLKNSLMGCAMEGESGKYFGQMGPQRKDGLVPLHAYTITKMAIVLMSSGKEQKLIRIKNPHGVGSVEWNGAWSDSSTKWREIVNNSEVDFKKEEDGEFWMSFQDFCRSWHRLYVCHLTPTAFTTEIGKSNILKNLAWKNLADDAWNSSIHHSAWSTEKNNSGGYDISSDKYFSNPKLYFKIEPNQTSTVIISLTQKKDILKRNMKQSNLSYEYCIRIDVYKMPSNFKYNKPWLKQYVDARGVLNASDFVNTSEVNLKLDDLVEGVYIIVVCTDHIDINLDFMVQFYSDENVKLKWVEEAKAETKAGAVNRSCPEDTEVFLETSKQPPFTPISIPANPELTSGIIASPQQFIANFVPIAPIQPIPENGCNLPTLENDQNKDPSSKRHIHFLEPTKQESFIPVNKGFPEEMGVIDFLTTGQLPPFFPKVSPFVIMVPPIVPIKTVNAIPEMDEYDPPTLGNDLNKDPASKRHIHFLEPTIQESFLPINKGFPEEMGVIDFLTTGQRPQEESESSSQPSHEDGQQEPLNPEPVEVKDHIIPKETNPLVHKENKGHAEHKGHSGHKGHSEHKGHAEHHRHAEHHWHAEHHGHAEHHREFMEELEHVFDILGMDDDMEVPFDKLVKIVSIIKSRIKARKHRKDLNQAVVVDPVVVVKSVNPDTIKVDELEGGYSQVLQVNQTIVPADVSSTNLKSTPSAIRRSARANEPCSIL